MDKVVVLAAGLGRRMRSSQADGLDEQQRQAADSGIKAMVPIDRPFLDYVLSTVADAGISQICLVIGPRHDELRQYYETVETRRLRISFAVQPEPLGTANALAAAREFAGADDFVVLNSDNHYPLEALAALRSLTGPGLVGFDGPALSEQGNIPAERISGFAVIDTDDDGMLRGVVEKPSAEWLAQRRDPVVVSMNCWRFDENIFTACSKIGLSERGEYEITAAAQYTIDQMDVQMRVVPVAAPVLDMTSRDDISSVTEHLRGRTVQL